MTCAVTGVVELLVARPARCARVVEPARWSGWLEWMVDDESRRSAVAEQLRSSRLLTPIADTPHPSSLQPQLCLVCTSPL